MTDQTAAFLAANAYAPSLTEYMRRQTREVMVGHVGIGGANPIRVQSMTTTDTMDTEATVAQSIRMIEAGCELVRITAPSINEARNLENIKRELHARGYKAPLVADIHFTPNAAEVAARIVEKVRINPGNFADKKKFEEIDYTDDSYEAELERIRAKFIPLVRICKEYGTAMRIGTNHGSLSDRIMSRYGDSPLGMVESALEFLRIAESENYYNIVLSMKASNTLVMVQAYRLLVNRMDAEGMNYPLHLGVTEAGDGEDGRIKSAVGIGTLLEDGLGDTIRVSLTEEPEAELPVARAIVARYTHRAPHDPIPAITNTAPNAYLHTRRTTHQTHNLGLIQVPRVMMRANTPVTNEESLTPYGYRYDRALDKWHVADQAADFLVMEAAPEWAMPRGLMGVLPYEAWASLNGARLDEFAPWCPDFDRQTGLPLGQLHPTLNFLRTSDRAVDEGLCEWLKAFPTVVPVLYTTNQHAMPALRRAMLTLVEHDVKNPVIIERAYDNQMSHSDLQLYAATDFGGLLLDGYGDGVFLEAAQLTSTENLALAFGSLQATRSRISKTEYIACPSCGRTLFDLQETTAKIRAVTSHLKGVKIGIMGCIVNGPGEMADADFGYVGSGPGKITLYKGKEVVEKNVPEARAVDALIGLIRASDRWVEPLA